MSDKSEVGTDQPEYVVGIGASAGGLEAIQALVDCLPKTLDNVCLVINQHLSPDYKSMLVELLSRKTDLAVEHVENGQALQSNRIYIAPPSDDVVVKDGQFQFRKPLDVGAHPSADVLFASLAKAYGPKSAGVILSGTGKDGTRGLTAISKIGGLTIAQDPVTAKYDGMPQSAIGSGIVSHVLPPGKIGSQLMKLLNSSTHPVEAEVSNEIPEAEEAFTQIFQLLEHRIGTDFSDYKSSTLNRRLQKRIQERHFSSEEEYLSYIKRHPEELDQLFEAMLIGVTEFFRDPEAFNALEETVKTIINNKKENELIRIWIPGCATGEEAYTLAMILSQQLADSNKRLSLQIFATDIDMKALQVARQGRYQVSALKRVPSQYRRRFFKKLNDTTYEVDKDIKKLVLFSRHDVTANPPFLRLDLITCRNLLIYFNTDLQKKVLPLFYYALNSKGYLMLGKSENVGKLQNLFSTTSSPYKIFQKKGTAKNIPLKFPQLRPHTPPGLNPAITEDSAGSDLSIKDMVKETLFNDYGHPFVVIDDRLDIVEINGDISKFVKFKPGNATLNLSRLMIPELQIEVRSISTLAINNMRNTIGHIRKLGTGEGASFVRLSVRPLLYAQPNNPYFLVIFETLDLDKKILQIANVKDEITDTPRTLELEHELDATKEHMNSLLEELETSNEELQALNEEMQASNEELQASNEELETSNEELQATNEELENAYSEIREAQDHIIQQKTELERAADNQSTLLNNTLVGFILIDRDYRVITSNKTARKMYKDIFGTQISENSSYMKALPDNLFAAFHKNFKHALRGKQLVTEETYEDSKGTKHYFDVNYTPVKKSLKEKEARYIAVSFVDMTHRRKAQLDLIDSNRELEEEKQFMSSLTENLPGFVWTTDPKGGFIYCNKQLLAFTGLEQGEFEHSGLKNIVHEDDWKATERIRAEALKNSKPMAIEHRIRRKDGSYKWYLTVADAVKDKDGKVRMWVGSSIEVEDLKKQQEMETRVEKLKSEQEELIRVNKVKDEFIGIASHQLRSPATAVKQYLELVIQGYGGPLSDKQDKYLHIAHDSNERQLTVINDLLKTAQLDASDYKVHSKRQNIHDMLEKIIDEFEPVLAMKDQIIKLTCPKDLTAKMEPDDMKLAVVNLIENAIKYSHPGEKIEVKVVQADHHIRIMVKDRGVGIDSENHSRIFDKFSRIDNELSDTVYGSGLGLYWVKRIVELHNGQVEVNSKLNQGSTFTVVLPV
ncbi:MAG TPA: CheR family methyltransferase [Candidatus Saccharimonadales bacterium]|nr:CheR family methyltransferase [Candidatus Saccharimonadales bacterium]